MDDVMEVVEPDCEDGLPEEVADCWAAVLIDLYDKRREAEHAEHRVAG